MPDAYTYKVLYILFNIEHHFIDNRYNYLKFLKIFT